METIDRATWRKSSYSGTNGGGCVEVGVPEPGREPAASLWASLHGLVTLQVTRPAFPWPPLADMIARIAAL